MNAKTILIGSAALVAIAALVRSAKAAAIPPSAVTTPSTAPVIAVTADRIMDRDPATEIVGLRVQIGQGNGIQSEYSIYVDGIKVGIGSRIPNSIDTSTSVLLLKDGKSHSICADSICTSYTTSLLSLQDGTAPVGTPVCIVYPSFESPHSGIIKGNWTGYAYNVLDETSNTIIQMPWIYLTLESCINVVPPCSPVWKCEQPLTGYSNDGCGHRVVTDTCKSQDYALAGTYKGYKYYTSPVNEYLWLILSSGFIVGGFRYLSGVQDIIDLNEAYLISKGGP